MGAPPFAPGVVEKAAGSWHRAAGDRAAADRPSGSAGLERDPVGRTRPPARYARRPGSKVASVGKQASTPEGGGSEGGSGEADATIPV
ncbi:hypothetical protein AB0N06_10270, partial [Streptomyces sp. NPDC051020]|uniref:hypothetical protein n=1 Tax=Streptomyces sp. NPDC051020 TaxID=3155409 RepID=UPI003437428C